jgi:uncharacterized protein with FMN-binding domain
MKKFSKTAMMALLALSLTSKTFAATQANGEFVGSRENAYYGYVKVVAVVKNGKLADIKILESPNHAGRSQYISSVALPWLVQEAVQVQKARVNLISGATMTSEAFSRSLDSALRKAGV